MKKTPITDVASQIQKIECYVIARLRRSYYKRARCVCIWRYGFLPFHVRLRVEGLL